MWQMLAHVVGRSGRWWWSAAVVAEIYVAALVGQQWLSSGGTGTVEFLQGSSWDAVPGESGCVFDPSP